MRARALCAHVGTKGHNFIFLKMDGYMSSLMTEYSFVINLIATAAVGVILGWFFRGRYGGVGIKVTQSDASVSRNVIMADFTFD